MFFSRFSNNNIVTEFRVVLPSFRCPFWLGTFYRVSRAFTEFRGIRWRSLDWFKTASVAVYRVSRNLTEFFFITAADPLAPFSFFFLFLFFFRKQKKTQQGSDGGVRNGGGGEGGGVLSPEAVACAMSAATTKCRRRRPLKHTTRPKKKKRKRQKKMERTAIFVANGGARGGGGGGGPKRGGAFRFTKAIPISFFSFFSWVCVMFDGRFLFFLPSFTGFLLGLADVHRHSFVRHSFTKENLLAKIFSSISLPTHEIHHLKFHFIHDYA